MSKIKKIYTFGTSYTAGGGFEFGNSGRELLSSIYNNIGEDLTRESFSWPGQLSKLLPSSIEVINKSESGFGNDRMIRLILDIILHKEFKKDETLFFLEFSLLGRKEIYSNQLDDYMIVNYAHSDDNHTKLMGYSRNYVMSENDLEKDNSKLPDESFFEDFVKNTINVDNELRIIVNDTIMILNLLNSLDIRYYLTQPPIIEPRFVDMLNLKNRFINFDGTNYMLELGLKDSYYGSITEETGDLQNDGHFGLISSKLISSKIHDKLVEENIIDSAIMNLSREYFDDIKNIINSNIKSIKNKI